MENRQPHELVLTKTVLATTEEEEVSPIAGNPTDNPFKMVIDPALRFNLKKALVELIMNHEEWLAQTVAGGKLALDSYKEYVELFARSLKETMETREGVAYLLKSAGFDVKPGEINLHPEWRWKPDASPSD
jgi:hypothetical protein